MAGALPGAWRDAADDEKKVTSFSPDRD